MEAPTGQHVHVLPSGTRCPARGPEVWQRYRALYGEGYDWAPATPEEIKEVADQDAYFAEHGCYPP